MARSSDKDKIAKTVAKMLEGTTAALDLSGQYQSAVEMQKAYETAQLSEQTEVRNPQDTITPDEMQAKIKEHVDSELLTAHSEANKDSDLLDNQDLNDEDEVFDSLETDKDILVEDEEEVFDINEETMVSELDDDESFDLSEGEEDDLLEEEQEKFDNIDETITSEVDNDDKENFDLLEESESDMINEESDEGTFDYSSDSTEDAIGQVDNNDDEPDDDAQDSNFY